MDREQSTSINLPPHDLDAEEAVLGSLLLEGHLISQCLLEPSDFYRDKYQWIFEAMRELERKGEGINQITVAVEIKKRGLLDEMGGAQVLSYCVRQVPTTVHFEYYANIVGEKSDLRKLIIAAKKAAGFAYNSDPEALSKARELLRNLDGRGLSGLLSPTEYTRQAEERLGTLMDRTVSFIPFGLPRVDRLCGGGAYGGEYIILGGRPSMGKSTLLKQWGREMGRDHTLLFCQAEMSQSQMIDRDLGAEVAMQATDVRRGGYTEETYDRLYGGLTSLADLQVWRFIRGTITTAEIRAAAERIDNLGGILVDYLQNLSVGDTRLSTYEKVSRISADLRTLAKDLDIPVIVAAQLSRRLEERQNKRPELADLRESGTIEQDGDVIMFLYRRDAYQDCPDDLKGRAELHLAKHRQGGRTGTVCLQWRNDVQEYGEADRNKDEVWLP